MLSNWPGIELKYMYLKMHVWRNLCKLTIDGIVLSASIFKVLKYRSKLVKLLAEFQAVWLWLAAKSWSHWFGSDPSLSTFSIFAVEIIIVRFMSYWKIIFGDIFFARSSSNSPRSLEDFRRTLVPNFIQIRQRVKNFPIDPRCNNWSLSATL